MHGLRTQTRRSRTAVALVVALGLTLAACSDAESGAKVGGGANADIEAATDPAGPKPTKSPIKIGLEVSLTGTTASSYFGVQPTAEAWATWVNETQGGINGHPVSIEVRDTKGDAGATLAGAKELMADESVLAMLIADSQAEGVLAEPLESSGVPVIGGSSVSTESQGVRTNYFTTGSMNPYYMVGLLKAAKATGATKVGAVVCAESPECAHISGLFKSASGEIGLDYTGTVAVAASAPNYTAPCLSLIGKGTDFAAVVVAGAVLLRVAKDCNGQGYKGTFGAAGQSVLPGEFGQLDGLKMAGTIQGFPWWSTAKPVKRYVSVMKRYMSKSDFDDLAWANGSATNIWASLELFRKANAEMSDSPTRAEVTDAYHQIKDETLDGLLPNPITFTAGKPASPNNCFWTYSYEDKQFTTVEPDGESGNGVSGDLATTCVEVGAFSE